jgi:DNA-binding PadR family transcriptional regulator
LDAARELDSATRTINSSSIPARTSPTETIIAGRFLPDSLLRAAPSETSQISPRRGCSVETSAEDRFHSLSSALKFSVMLTRGAVTMGQLHRWGLVGLNIGLGELGSGPREARLSSAVGSHWTHGSGPKATQIDSGILCCGLLVLVSWVTEPKFALAPSLLLGYDRSDASRHSACHITMSPTESDPATRSPAPIKLTPTSYLMLGMVRLGITSGYAIKKVADRSTQNFWPTSLAQVYPELARLQGAGLLTRRSDPQGGRARSAYAITERGEAALRAWLRSPTLARVQMRDEAMLRLFFADALGGEDRLGLIRMLRERNHDLVDELRSENIPRAEALESHGTYYLALSARLTADCLAYAERWLARLEVKLEAEQEVEATGTPESEAL